MVGFYLEPGEMSITFFLLLGIALSPLLIMACIFWSATKPRRGRKNQNL